MEETEWVTCPLCSDEWTKLRPCRFLADDYKEMWTNVCVRCAESAVSMEKVTDLYPISYNVGLAVDIKWAGPSKHREVHEVYGREQNDEEKKTGDKPPFKISVYEADLPKNAYAIVRCGSDTFVVRSKDAAPYIEFKRKDAEKSSYADNIFVAWSMIKHQIVNGEVV